MSFIVPALDPRVSATAVAQDLTIVISDAGARALPGRLFPLILPLVDGHRSVDAIAGALEGTATIVDVMVGVSELIDEGVLCDTAAADVAPLRVRSTTPRQPAAAGIVVSVAAIDGIDQETVDIFSAALSGEGVHLVDRSVPGARTILLVDRYAGAGLDAFNRVALRTSSPWLIVKPLGVSPWVGPLFDTGNDSPCWQCLATRLTEGEAVEAYVARHYPGTTLRRPRPLAIAGAVADAARLAVDALLDPDSSTILRAVDARDGSISIHAVMKRSDCRACGGVRVSPSTSLARHISPITGVVRRVSSWSLAGSPVHVAIADHLFGPEIELPDSIWRQGFRRTAGGGATVEEARTAAVGEAIERYSGVYRECDAGRLATYAALGPAAIHPNDVNGFSAAQFRDRDRWNAASTSGYTRVPEPFDEDAEYAWTQLHALETGEVRWLPTACCYFAAQPERDRAACFGGSNGCAAGETFEDAIVRGFLELVERDAVGIWWHNRLDRPGIDLSTIPDPFVRSVTDSYARAGRTLDVLDITTDLGIPVCAAVSRDAATGERLTLGFGAHLDPSHALRHAVRELNLFLPEILEGRRRALFAGPAPSGSYLEAAGTRAWPVPEQPRGGDELARIQQVARIRALQILVLDQTRADVGVPVVRVVVPGLCHFWPRFGVRRLQSVPLDMGWRTEPVPERHLNRSFMLF